MKFCLVLICVVVSALSVPTERALQEWNGFKATHKKLYRDAAEESFRQRLFLEELQRVDEHNEKYKEGLVSYEKGINQFSDLTPQEIRQLTSCSINPEKLPLSNIKEYVIPDGFIAPDHVDWREKGVVTAVKNQCIPRSCGSCWAFSAVATLESQWAINKGQLVDLSEQQLLDCDHADHACHGGWIDNAFDHIVKNNGIATEESYPYEGVNTTCRYEPEMRGATMQDYVQITKGDEEAMKAALAQTGPLSVAFDSTSIVSYKKGIFNDPKCGKLLGHAVSIVGYGTEDGLDYWLVKNSWDTNWGEDGYFRIVRNSNQCGIADYVWQAVV